MSAFMNTISCERPAFGDCWRSLRLLTAADVNADDSELHTPLSKTAAAIATDKNQFPWLTDIFCALLAKGMHVEQRSFSFQEPHMMANTDLGTRWYLLEPLQKNIIHWPGRSPKRTLRGHVGLSTNLVCQVCLMLCSSSQRNLYAGL